MGLVGLLIDVGSQIVSKVKENKANKNAIAASTAQAAPMQNFAATKPQNTLQRVKAAQAKVAANNVGATNGGSGNGGSAPKKIPYGYLAAGVAVLLALFYFFSKK